MEFDILQGFEEDVEEIIAMAQAAEDLGFGALWLPEAKHNPYLSIAAISRATDRLGLGTAIALAFPRSPMVTAQIAWDLARASQGRFVLGLGSQVKAHIERRFSVPFSRPTARLREYVLALRAIFAAFQGDQQLAFEGEFYSLSLLPDFFSPGPSEYGDIPIYVGGANAGTARIAGEVCDGFHVHPLHSRRYLQEVIRPAVDKGLATSGRPAGAVKLCVPVFVITGDSDEEREQLRDRVRHQLAFYGSTPTYRPVFELHGWEEVSLKLKFHQSTGDFNGMADCISDDILDAFSVSGEWDSLPEKLWQRYGGLADRIMPYWMGPNWYRDPEAGQRWGAVATGLAWCSRVHEGLR